VNLNGYIRGPEFFKPYNAQTALDYTHGRPYTYVTNSVVAGYVWIRLDLRSLLLIAKLRIYDSQLNGFVGRGVSGSYANQIALGSPPSADALTHVPLTTDQFHGGADLASFGDSNAYSNLQISGSEVHVLRMEYRAALDSPQYVHDVSHLSTRTAARGYYNAPAAGVAS
jgi:hypothetical protein